MPILNPIDNGKKRGLSSFSALYPQKHTAGKPMDFLTRDHCSFTKTSPETPRIIWEYCILIFLNNSYPALKQNLSFKNYSTLFYNNIFLLFSPRQQKYEKVKENSVAVPPEEAEVSISAQLQTLLDSDSLPLRATQP